MDPDLFITIVFCSLVFGLAVGAGAVLVRSALRVDAGPHESERANLSGETKPVTGPRGRSAERKHLDGLHP